MVNVQGHCSYISSGCGGRALVMTGLKNREKEESLLFVYCDVSYVVADYKKVSSRSRYEYNVKYLSKLNGGKISDSFVLS